MIVGLWFLAYTVLSVWNWKWCATFGAKTGAVVVLGLGAAGCVHKIASPLVAPVVRWTIPLTMDDQVAICVESTIGVEGVAPADAQPLTCVSVATLRAWLRAQRTADE